MDLHKRIQIDLFTKYSINQLFEIHLDFSMGVFYLFADNLSAKTMSMLAYNRKEQPIKNHIEGKTSNSTFLQSYKK